MQVLETGVELEETSAVEVWIPLWLQLQALGFPMGIHDSHSLI